MQTEYQRGNQTSYNFKYLIPEPGSSSQQTINKAAEFIWNEMPVYYDYSVKNPDKIPINFLRRAGVLGLMGFDIPKDLGGLGLTTEEMTKITRASAYESAGLALSWQIVADTLTLKPIELSLDPKYNVPNEVVEKRKEILRQLIAGQERAFFAITEPEHGSDATHIEFKATKGQFAEKDGYYLSGVKSLITNTIGARYAILSTFSGEKPGAKAISSFLVDLQDPDMKDRFKVKGIFEKGGQAGAVLTEIQFDNFFVDNDSLLGEENKGWEQILTDTFFNSRIQIAAQGLGLMERAFDEAVMRARSREQFGKPIIDQPQVRNQLAMMERQMKLSEYLVNKAARMKDSGNPDYHVWASLAKLIVGDSVLWITAGAQEIWGGLGYTTGYFPKDGSQITIGYENPIVNRLVDDAKIIKTYEGAANVLKRNFIDTYFTPKELIFMAEHLKNPDFHWDNYNYLLNAEEIMETIETFKPEKKASVPDKYLTVEELILLFRTI